MKNLAFFLLSVFLSFYFDSLKSQPYYTKRNEIPVEYTWDLSHLFENWQQWEQKYKDLSPVISGYGNLKGTLNKGEVHLYRAFSSWDSLFNETMKLYLYAMMLQDLNDQDMEAAKHLQLANNLQDELFMVSAFLEPELLTLDENQLQLWFNTSQNLLNYKHAIMNSFRRKEHILPEEQEELICLFHGPYSTSTEIYDELFYTDSNPPEVILDNGDTVLLSSTMSSHIAKYDTNRNNRIKAYNASFKTYLDKKNTCALILKNTGEMDWALAQAYGFYSTLESKLFNNNIPVSVFENVIKTLRYNSSYSKIP